MLCLSSGAILRRDKRGYTHPSCLSCRILLSSTCVSTYRVRVLYISTQLEGGGEDGGGGAEARSRRSPQRFGCRPGAIFSVYCCGPEKKYHSKSIALLVNRLRNCFSGQELYRVSDGYFNTLSRFSFCFLIVLTSRHITFWTKNKYNTSLN